MTKPNRPPYVGPALFSYGFRPLFLAAGLFAAGIVPLWMAVWSGDVFMGGPFSPIDWHIHEMLFGYTSAVIAGFLFTAIPNWTGRMPTRGWSLMVLAGWLAVAGLLDLGSLAVMAVDCAFMAAIGAMVTTEIVAGRNWENLKVIAPVLAYLAANVCFHLEAMTTGSADVGRRRLVPAPTGLWCAAVLWTLGFGLFVWRFTPVLTQPNPARRQPNGR